MASKQSLFSSAGIRQANAVDYSIGLLFAIIICLNNMAHGQSLLFQKVIGGKAMDNLTDIQLVSGGFVLMGNTTGFGARQNDVLLCRTDDFGDVLWTKTFGTAADDYAVSVISTLDKGYAMAVNSSDSVGKYIMLLKADSSGILQWAKSYRRSDNDIALCLSVSKDGGFLLGGSTEINPPFNNDAYLIKTDSAGNILWTRTFGDVDDDGIARIAPLPNGHFIAAGFLYSAPSLKQGFFLTEMDSSGNRLWEKAYAGDSGLINISDLKIAPDGRIVLAGGYFTFSGSASACLLVSNSNGALIQSKTLSVGNRSLCYSICTNSKGYTLCGETSDAAQTNRDGFLVQTDTAGKPIRGSIFGNNQTDLGKQIRALPDGYIVAGASSFNDPQGDGYLLRTDTNGRQACLQSIPVNAFPLSATPITIHFTNSAGGTALPISLQQQNITVTATTVCPGASAVSTNQSPFLQLQPYPNPSEGEFWVEAEAGNYVIQVFDGLARCIYKHTLHPGKNAISIGEQNAAGLYYYMIQRKNQVISSGRLLIRR